MSEVDVYKQLARYMNIQHPDVPYHFDLSGVNNPSRYSRTLYGLLNERGFPDFFLATPAPFYSDDGKVEYYTGLFLEIKKEGETVYKKDGTLRKSDHLREQEQMLHKLAGRGYFTSFAVGFDQCKQLVDEYLRKDVL